MTDELLRAQLTAAVERLTPLLQAATRHGFRDADTLRSITKCRDMLSRALGPDATEDELRLALTLTAELGPRLFAAVKPGGRP
jgi:hypothetical protein